MNNGLKAASAVIGMLLAAPVLAQPAAQSVDCAAETKAMIELLPAEITPAVAQNAIQKASRENRVPLENVAAAFVLGSAKSGVPVTESCKAHHTIGIMEYAGLPKPSLAQANTAIASVAQSQTRPTVAQAPAPTQPTTNTVTAPVVAPAPAVAAAPAPQPAVNYAPQISALEKKLEELQNRPQASLTAGEKQQLASLPSVVDQLKQAQVAAAAAQQSAVAAAKSEAGASGFATASGLSATKAAEEASKATAERIAAETAAAAAAASEAKANGWTWFDIAVAAVLALLTIAVAILFVKKASKKSVQEVEQTIADGVKNRMGIEIPDYLEQHLEALAPGRSEEFEFVSDGEEFLVKFTKVDSNMLGVKLPSVVTADIREQTQPMKIHTLRNRLLGHIESGRLSASTVKQVKGSVLELNRNQEAA